MAKGSTNRLIAGNLAVDESTVARTVRLFCETGDVATKQHPSDTNRKLTEPAQLFILNLVLQKPGIYLHEIQDEVREMLMLEISLATICTFLHSSGFTRQRLRTVAIQQDTFLRQKYIIDVSAYMYSSNMFVFVDETGADGRNKLRRYAYSLRGSPAVIDTLLVRGERVSAISCMSVNGILDDKGTSNGDVFYDFVQTHLIPHLI